MTAAKMNETPETPVLGAGPAGLACAMELAREGRQVRLAVARLHGGRELLAY